jgi:hypothetical protein
MSIRCRQCGCEVARDGQDRLPPWCPSCGSDVKIGAAAAAPAAAPAAEGDPVPAFASAPAGQPTAAGIADPPDEESLQALVARLAAARNQPSHYSGKGRLVGLRYFLIGLFIVAIALAWLYAE